MDRYIQDSVVGKGAYATVFRATHRETGAKVALKLLDLEVVTDLEEVLVSA
jgi:serine/threonine protein kinase